MSDSLASQLTAFKRSLKRASAVLPAQKRVVQSSAKSRSPLRSAVKRSMNDREDQKGKRARKADHSASSDSLSSMSSMAPPPAGSSLSIRLMTASDFIKGSDRPVTIQDLEMHLNSRVDPQLLKCLANVDRIKYDPVNKTLEYLSLHNIKTAEDLLKVLENQPTFQGLSVKQLRDGWNGCLPTIAELEKENKIIVHKTKKENSPRHIWLNYGNIKVGDRMDVEFYDMWGKVEVPKGGDLVQALLDNGMKPTNVDPESLKNKKDAPIQQRKQKKPRRGKITNIHMKGILKDYSGRV
ncbi:DEKNAAC102295 [Brettanomyces naardenensis]|uniref:Transcription initiation factor IIE subunit beta n=1 Tax=Brettanomyces naardenensis TaxID=13370 RepID=A0A448YKP1_BRENA|nr:DEKNAAC102295 [Brettanomyces naardenensis]